MKKYMDQQLDELLKGTKVGNEKEVDDILNKIPEDISNEAKRDIKEKKRGLIDELGRGGWNPLHFAIFCNQPNLVKKFIERGADVNKVNADGWTPLELSIHKNNTESKV